MRIAICDDEKQFCVLFKQLLDTYSKKRAVVMLCDEFNSGEALLESNNRYALIFLDYQMEDLNGMETARKLREMNNKATIIFLTSHSHIVFESFEVDAFRFLTKPTDEGKLFKALDDYLLSFNESEYLIINRPNITRIKFDDIIYVEATGKTCVIHTFDETIEYARVMAEIEKSLPKDRFFKSHKSFIVGLKYVKGRLDKDILLENGEKVFLAVSKTAAFKQAFIDYMKRYVFEVGE